MHYTFLLLLDYKQARVGMRVKAIRLSIVGWRLICFWWLDLFYTAFAALLLKKLVFAVFIINTAIIHMYSLYVLLQLYSCSVPLQLPSILTTTYIM